ncbi:MAG: metallophosphatase family protein [Tepidanaerobacteraceae bacterium]|nr:metallophosphatase family protein [Tepidanaerobacteraceae bacterium]
MKLAVFSDVHSNLYALEAVLSDMEKFAVDRVICCGDLVGYGAHPNEVVELIADNGIFTVMGNYDDGVGFDRLLCGCDFKNEEEALRGEKSLLWTRQKITFENKQMLRQLPKKLEFEIEGRKALMVHGSHRALNEYLHETLPKEDVSRIFSETGADIIFCGHTHIPYIRNHKDKFLVNAGTVGKPKPQAPDEKRFSNDAVWIYADINDDDNIFRIMRVPYDYEKSARAIEESGLPHQFADYVRGINPDL